MWNRGPCRVATISNFQAKIDGVRQLAESAKMRLQGAPPEFEFEKQIPLEKRTSDCEKIFKKHPDKVPVICEVPSNRRSNVPQISSKKFLVPKVMTVSQLVVVVKKQLESENTSFNPNTAIYFTLKNRSSVQPGAKLDDIHQKHRSEDGFLYLHYSEEQVFG